MLADEKKSVAVFRKEEAVKAYFRMHAIRMFQLISTVKCYRAQIRVARYSVVIFVQNVDLKASTESVSHEIYEELKNNEGIRNVTRHLK
jgi:Ni,Fe-hydrogenase maturation factor